MSSPSQQKKERDEQGEWNEIRAVLVRDFAVPRPMPECSYVEKDDAAELHEELSCSICMKIADAAASSACCGTLVCAACVEAAKVAGVAGCGCRDQEQSFRPNLPVQRIVRSLEVECSACSARMKRDRFEAHAAESCSGIVTKIFCPSSKRASGRCLWTGTVDDLGAHLRGNCCLGVGRADAAAAVLRGQLEVAGWEEKKKKLDGLLGMHMKATHGILDPVVLFSTMQALDIWFLAEEAYELFMVIDSKLHGAAVALDLKKYAPSGFWPELREKIWYAINVRTIDKWTRGGLESDHEDLATYKKFELVPVGDHILLPRLPAKAQMNLFPDLIAHPSMSVTEVAAAAKRRASAERESERLRRSSGAGNSDSPASWSGVSSSGGAGPSKSAASKDDNIGASSGAASAAAAPGLGTAGGGGSPKRRRIGSTSR